LQTGFILFGGRVPAPRSPVSNEKYHTKNIDEAQLEKNLENRQRAAVSWFRMPSTPLNRQFCID
jgi:hypothetical protein